MRINRFAVMAALVAAGFAQAQDLKVNALTEFWYTQMLNTNLRWDSAAKPGGASSYYEGLSSGRFSENSFHVKRVEISGSWKVSDEWAANFMFDPNLPTNTVTNNILQDLAITWTPAAVKGLTVKAGQFKMPTVYESTLVASREILFFDRAQLARQFGERRDRGVWFAYSYGDPKGFKGTFNVAVSNGSSDDGSSGKQSVDANAQKDYTFRYDASYGANHKFGVYHRVGETNMKTAGAVTLPAAWSAAGVTNQAVLDNRDKTTLTGAFYAFDNAKWHFEAEGATGILGRRYPSLFTTAATPLREHLDQTFLGYQVTGVYKMGAHQFLARYDFMNYNSGDDWYTTYNPYKMANATTGLGYDLTPKYTEVTAGYNYLFNPSKATYGKIKVNYIWRSKNFLLPRTGQTGEQGGDSLVVSFMIAY
ncbi:OprO/OprP family phosphate-selective porin [Mesoterricola sediminis]|uniref:Porin n=1 Tax=Mesoterricola sediminis TaxID=2927980 RepID=A0AA48GSY0_9BACT|nr:OprO/OprP family phosphate-selective porin [Mesoterricola sediminis]BDU75599.1 hypothetical protein METESE_05570 [Mesoterricola sediminis]